MRSERSADALGEGEIQELLDRPRVMGGEAEAEAEVVKSDVIQAVAMTPSGTNLVRRKFSVDGGRRSEEVVEMMSPASGIQPKTRHSVDIAEILRRR